jgi:hypothetical protein
VIAAFGAFMATVAILAGAGYAISEIAVRQPRDPFRTGSFEFDLAPGWWCGREGAEYVCDPPGKPPFPAIAVIAIKERNRDDNLKAYEDHLRQPQPLANKTGNATLSTVSYVKRVKLGHADWIEALHLGSEVPNYNTYYLATVTSHLGILVTMSVHRDQQRKYVDQLNDMMNSLNLYQK